MDSDINMKYIPMQRFPSDARSYPGGQEQIKLPGVLMHWPLLQMPCCEHSLMSRKRQYQNKNWNLKFLLYRILKKSTIPNVSKQHFFCRTRRLDWSPVQC